MAKASAKSKRKFVEMFPPKDEAHLRSPSFTFIEASEDRLEKVRRRAYEIYLSEGSEPNRDLEHWYRAERELS